jgi:hypothetical protein
MNTNGSIVKLPAGRRLSASPIFVIPARSADPEPSSRGREAAYETPAQRTQREGSELLVRSIERSHPRALRALRPE